MWAVFNAYINVGVKWMVEVGAHALLPILCAAFAGGVLVRIIIYLTVKAEAAFALEFEKRVHKHLADPKYEPGVTSFHELTRKLLERTFDEHYNMRRKHRRRRFDQITSITDRIFLVVEGASRLISDTLSQTKYLRKDGQPPRFVDIAKFVFESNPVFNRVLGVLPLGMFNDMLNILPGLFVVGGIFGTFLGVMSALPELSHIDLNDAALTKTVMDKFLLNMAFSMGAWGIGIIFGVMLTVINAMLNPEGIYYAMVNKYTSALEFLWNDTTTNEVTNDAAYPTDRRAVAFSNLPKKGQPEAAASAPAPIRAEQPSRTMAVAPAPPPPEPKSAPEVIYAPPPAQPAASVSAPDNPFTEEELQGLGDVFEKMDAAFTELDAEAAPVPPEEDRLAVLRHRLAVLDSYLVKADEDKATGLMSEEMWKDETQAYRQEREHVEAQIRDIETKRAA